MTQNAGVSSEWYILALSQSGEYHFSAYQQALENYINSHEVYSASTRLKYALVLASVGAKNSPYIQETLSNSIGEQGVMSWIYGLHLLNNGFTCEEHSADDVIHMLLSLQLPDFGWAVMGANGDIDVTAMAVQSLAPYYGEIPEVHQAIDNAVNFLAERQKDDGGYASFGTDNLESTAQVVTALSSIGVDGFSDERFIKENHTLLDGINRYRLTDGSYSHIDNGEMNFLATMQAFYTFVAYERFQDGKSPLYILDAVQNPISEPIPDEPPLETVIPENPDTPPQQDISPIVDSSPTAPEFPSQDTPSPETESETDSTTETAPTTSIESTISTVSTFLTSDTSVLTESTSMTTAISDTSTTNTTLTTSVSSHVQSTFTVPTSSNIPTSTTTISTFSTTFIQPDIENTNHNSFSTKMIVMLAILGCGVVASIVLFALKKRNPKNFLFVGIVTIIGMSAVYFIRIESANQYYSDKFDQKTNKVLSQFAFVVIRLSESLNQNTFLKMVLFWT